MVTGQRVIDTFFPIAGGCRMCSRSVWEENSSPASLAKWADADIIVYVVVVSGNEMTDVLNEFQDYTIQRPVKTDEKNSVNC